MARESQAPAAPPRRIAYVMSRFPKITETAILREMVELEHLGWRVAPFALIREHERVPHPGIDHFLARTHFGSAQRGCMLRANLATLVRHPGVYGRLLARTFRYFYRSPGMLIRSLICFPVAVHWARIARADGVSHIHAHFATHATYLAYIMAELAGIGYSFTAHAHDIYLDQAMLAEKIRRAKLVVPISAFNRQLLLRLCPDAAQKIHVVYCGVDTTAFRPRQSASSPEPSRALRIVTVGRLQEYKGVSYLVEACRLLKERGVPFECVIVGDGPDRRAIEEAIARYELGESVELAGWLPTSQVAQRLARADVFALPSVVARDGMMEGLPAVLMEAQGCGLPVVSTTISGIPELVRSGENGLLVPPRDAAALAEALTFLHAHPQERARMGQAGHARVVRDFDLSENTRRKAELFAAALEQPSA